MYMYETPCDFIYRGADILSPLFSSDATMLNRAKYQRICSNYNYSATKIDIDIIRKVMNFITSNDCNITDIVDSYIEWHGGESNTFNPLVCHKRIEWVNNELNYLHEYTNLLYNQEVFSIGIIECNETNDETWKMFTSYVTALLTENYRNLELCPELKYFTLYDDSSDGYHSLTLECKYGIKFSYFYFDDVKFVSNNASIIYNFRRLYDYVKMDHYIETHQNDFPLIGEINSIPLNRDISRPKIYTKYLYSSMLTADQCVEEYREINKLIFQCINNSKNDNTFDNIAMSDYRTFLDTMAIHNIAINIIYKMIVNNQMTNEALDEIFAISNTALFEIKDRYMQRYGLQTDNATMAYIYRGQLLHMKELFNYSLRR